MRCRHILLLASLSIWFSLGLTASGNAQSRLALQPTPRLNVFIYGSPELSAAVLERAESEASRILHPADIELRWINCASRALAASCEPPRAATNLIIRLLPKALPQAGAKALGIAGSSADYATAFIFYDRVLALRTHTHLVQDILGRVLAHEITHLLLPHEDHSEFGLMRGQWNADDLRMTSGACLGLSARSAQLMHTEAFWKMGSAPAAALHKRMIGQPNTGPNTNISKAAY
jgi:hypothetical protein